MYDSNIIIDSSYQKDFFFFLFLNIYSQQKFINTLFLFLLHIYACIYIYIKCLCYYFLKPNFFLDFVRQLNNILYLKEEDISNNSAVTLLIKEEKVYNKEKKNFFYQVRP